MLFFSSLLHVRYVRRWETGGSESETWKPSVYIMHKPTTTRRSIRKAIANVAWRLVWRELSLSAIRWHQRLMDSRVSRALCHEIGKSQRNLELIFFWNFPRESFQFLLWLLATPFQPSIAGLTITIMMTTHRNIKIFWYFRLQKEARWRVAKNWYRTRQVAQLQRTDTTSIVQRVERVHFVMKITTESQKLFFFQTFVYSTLLRGERFGDFGLELVAYTVKIITFKNCAFLIGMNLIKF